jgi:transketolase
MQATQKLHDRVGSELALAVEAHEERRVAGIRSRAVSMPSWELFDEQPQGYRDAVLPHAVGARLSIEQGSTLVRER